jgi:hypothetical protein
MDRVQQLHVEHFDGKGDPQALRDWYNDGADGAISWGDPGDFDACTAIAGKYMSDSDAAGFCQERHIDATGDPAGHAPGEENDKQDTAALESRIIRLEAGITALAARILTSERFEEERDANGRWTGGGSSYSGPAADKVNEIVSHHGDSAVRNALLKGAEASKSWRTATSQTDADRGAAGVLKASEHLVDLEDQGHSLAGANGKDAISNLSDLDESIRQAVHT